MKNKLLPYWVFYEITNNYEGEYQVLKLNGRPEVVQISAKGIKVFTSEEAVMDGIQPLFSHDFVVMVEEPSND